MMQEKELLEVNFISQDPERKTRRQTYFLAGIFTVIVAIISATGAHASYQAVRSGRSVFTEVSRLPVINDIRHLVFGDDGENSINIPPDDHLNILLLGIGGEGHDGSFLTDTILYGSLDTKNNTVGLVSIPRDLAYPLGNGQFEKINAVHAYEEQAHPGEGAKQTARAFEKLFDVRIDHVVRIDFKGFVAFIDAIGGIDVNVERAFTDWQYPTWDDKWMTILFKKGEQHMDGQTALIYTRSRHGNNGEGSDFARSRRQQLVILSAQHKLFSLGTLTDPKKLAALYSAIATHIQTDLSPWDAVKLATMVPNISRDRIKMNVLSDAPDGQLNDATVNGAFMLFPRKPDWSEIRTVMKNPYVIATKDASTSTKATIKPIESARVEIKNGTTRTGFASQIAAKVEKNDFEVIAFGNAIRRGYETTTIYDLTHGKKPDALARLRDSLNASVSSNIPPWIRLPDQNITTILSQDGLAPERIQFANTDFLVILGETSYPLIDPTYVRQKITQ